MLTPSDCFFFLDTGASDLEAAEEEYSKDDAEDDDEDGDRRPHNAKLRAAANGDQQGQHPHI